MAQDLPIKGKADLVNYLASGEKSPDNLRIGTEHEKFIYHRGNQQRVGYFEPGGIRQILTQLQQQTNMQPMMEGEHIIGLIGSAGDSITLEPGGQFELSGAPLKNLHATCAETNRHLEMMLNICKELNLQMFGLGHDPFFSPDEIEWMPKGRYQLMRRYMPTRGARGTEMMTQTATVQVNLDYTSEPDMVQKFRASLALQPIASAIFANSPFMLGRATGFQSNRLATWQDTDPDRTGFPAVVFDDGFGYELWVDYMLHVPMYFVKNYGANDTVIYHDALGKDFKKFMAGDYAEFKNRPAYLRDWEDHLTVAFTEVRLKKYLEMRGADAGQWQQLCALPAFWVGILYDHNSLAAANDMVAKWSVADMAAFGKSVAQLGLRAKLGKFTALDYARECYTMAEHGLKNRNQLNGLGSNETIFLEMIRQVVTTGQSPADQLLNQLTKQYNGDLSLLVRNLSF